MLSAFAGKRIWAANQIPKSWLIAEEFKERSAKKNNLTKLCKIFDDQRRYLGIKACYIGYLPSKRLSETSIREIHADLTNVCRIRTLVSFVDRRQKSNRLKSAFELQLVSHDFCEFERHSAAGFRLDLKLWLNILVVNSKLAGIREVKLL